jgi:hypothetical protein
MEKRSIKNLILKVIIIPLTFLDYFILCLSGNSAYWLNQKPYTNTMATPHLDLAISTIRMIADFYTLDSQLSRG